MFLSQSCRGEGANETDGDGHCGLNRGMLRRRTRERDSVTMINRGTLLALSRAAPGREAKGKRWRKVESMEKGKGHSQEAEGQDHNHLIVLLVENWSGSPSRS